MTYRLPALSFALMSMAVLAGCHTAKALLPETFIPPNLRPPTQDSAAALKQAKKKLQAASPCCSSFADFSYQTILPWHPQKFELGSDSMVANLNGAHSYFLTFRLPAGAKLPYRVAMKSELNGRWLASSYVFAPTIVLLDAGFQEIGSDDIRLCEHMGWSSETTGAFGTVTINSDKARYLLVYSSAAQQSGKTYWEQSPAAITTSSTTPTLDMSASGSFSVPHGPDGTLWIGMMDKIYAKAVDNGICKKPSQGAGELNTLRKDLPIPWIKDRSDSDKENSTERDSSKSSKSSKSSQ